jgi:hypothetical protein
MRQTWRISAVALVVAGAGKASVLPAAAVEASIGLEVGQEFIQLPALQFGGTYNVANTANPAIVEPLGQQSGALNGTRTDIDVSFADHHKTWATIHSFYVSDHASIDSSCVSSSNAAACDAAPLTDPSTTLNNRLGTGAGETVTFTGHRDVRHWGVSGALPLGTLSTDDGRWETRIGLGFRDINQSIGISDAFSLRPAHSQDYSETLETYYSGLFLAFTGTQNLNPSLHLTLDGEAGLYEAHAGFEGSLNQTDDAEISHQQLSLANDQAAFVGAVKLGLEQDWRWVRVGGFLRSEFYSYAPSVTYNQTDKTTALASGFSLKGQDGTQLDQGRAWTASAGARLTIPLGGDDE